MSRWRKVGQGLRVPSSHLGSVVETRSWPVRLWGPLVAAAHRPPWQDLGGEDSGAPGILEAEEVVGSTLGSLVVQ